MSTIAERTIPATEFALRTTLEDATDVGVEIERVVASDPDHVIPYVWFAGDESTLEDVEDALDSDPSVEEVVISFGAGEESE